MGKRDVIPFPNDISGFTVVALHTILEPERLAWLLDDQFNTGFWLLKEPLLIPSRKQTSDHMVFRSESLEEPGAIWLISHCHGLFAQKPKPDFLLVADGEFGYDQLSLWLKEIKQLQGVQTAYMLDEKTTGRFNWLSWLKDLEQADTENNNEELQ